MGKKAVLAITLIGIGCIGFFVFFVGSEENQKMSQRILTEEPASEDTVPVQPQVETKDVLILPGLQRWSGSPNR